MIKLQVRRQTFAPAALQIFFQALEILISDHFFNDPQKIPPMIFMRCPLPSNHVSLGQKVRAGIFRNIFEAGWNAGYAVKVAPDTDVVNPS